MVSIPTGVCIGQQFPVAIQGQELLVTCPPNARAGMSVRIVPPAPSPTEITLAPSDITGGGSVGRESSSSTEQSPTQQSEEPTQLFEVQVPKGVQPGQTFAVRVLVTCPTNASPGQRIRFKLPLALTNKPKPTNDVAQITLNFEKHG
jgi:hypothetical protein